MAVQMTRKEYEQLYGSKPVLTGGDSTFEPTPIRMTRAEYDKLYPKQEYQPPRGFGIKETAIAGIDNIRTGLEKTFGAAERARPEDDIFDEGLAKGTLETLFRGLRSGTEAVVGLGRTVGGVAQAGLSPILGPLNIAGEKIGEQIGRRLPVSVGSAAEGVSKNPIAMQALEDILDLSNLAIPEIGARGSAAFDPVKKSIEIKLQSGEFTPPQVRTFLEDRTSKQAISDLKELKTKNAKLRNNPFFDDESIQRIADAQAKTGLLNNATDFDGTIRTKETGIAQKYRELTIDGADGVVRQLLKREGAKVNVEEIASAMRVAADLKYEGADLINSIRAIEKELAGLRKRADEFGDVTLDKVQDMKIASTQYVDYTKPAAASFKKLKGSVYRQIIEDKSGVTIEVGGKQKTVKDINAELSKYYRDIENLEALDGMKVKGGRLGKYFSQIIGSMIGMTAGQVAGPLGAAVGGVIGAEAGGAIRGAQLSRAFGRGKAGDLKPNTLLQKAKDVGKKEAVVDLRKPDVRVGAPADVPKTKEIRAVEAQITKNVEAQKKAIAEKNFTLVATLKEVYRALVAKLKDLIEKASTGTVRGFARIDLGQSKSEGNLKSTQASTKGKTNSSTGGNNTTSFPGIPKELQPLAQEAKKYKSAEEFVANFNYGDGKLKDNAPTLTRIYRGGEPLDFSKSKSSGSGVGTYFSSDRDFAKGFADELSTGKYGKKENVGVDEMFVSPDAKILSRQDFPKQFLWDYEGGQLKFDDLKKLGGPQGLQDKVALWAKKNGYDIVNYSSNEGKNLIVLNGEKLLSKPQLTDLWNKVHGGTQAFEGFTDLSTKLLEKLKGRTTVSKQFISDLTNSPDLKQPERDLIRNLLEGEGKDVSVPDFANKVKSELLPLKMDTTEGVRGMEATAEARGSRYENITLPDELRGPVANYSERVYESPISTSAGDVHFSGDGLKNYFAHTRIEDLPAKNTRRVIELQSDLFQKGRLEQEFGKPEMMPVTQRSFGYEEKFAQRMKEIDANKAKLEPYRNTWHERVIREEVKQAAKDGKTKLQFPTGETAMKIEGLGERNTWYVGTNEFARDFLTPDRLKVGLDVTNAGDTWIITDVLGDGKFKAIQKNLYNGVDEAMSKPSFRGMTREQILADQSESFDISGKVDTNNPIYKFYEKEVGKYLKNKYGAELVTDPQGVKWWEVNVKPEMGKLPIEAFGAGLIPLGAMQEEQN